MMARVAIAVSLLLAKAAGSSIVRANSTATAPITEIVTIDGVEVYGPSSGHDQMNKCVDLFDATVTHEQQPVINVCGTGTKVIVFLRNRCEAYHTYSQTVGVCNSGESSSTCDEQSPATQSWMQTAQSYRIEAC
eukprot:TRINITY_DN950_c0_g1_i11.p1 TRINITY_DN950_c0_g1~~TRINITY_DN950_c0_g1_i11.p1  ORF type:complete len:134 (+),score=23.17 TRINITY_DN950_c0_g1_i11:63-464(+)